MYRAYVRQARCELVCDRENKMNCRTAKGLIESFIDNDIDGVVEAEMREHMAECESCREALMKMDAVDSRLRRVMKVHPSSGFSARVVAAVNDDIDVATGGQGISIRSACAPACLLLALIAFFVNTWMHNVEKRGHGGGRSGAERFTGEPAESAEYALGPEFVAVGHDRIVSNRYGTVRIKRVVRGAPVLVVNAFPVEAGSAGGSNK